MFRKFISTFRHQPTAERHAHEIDISPTNPERTEEDDSVPLRAPVRKPEPMRTALGTIFPRQESIFRRKELPAFTALKIESSQQYAGLANQMYALAARPIRKSEDASTQLAARLRELKALAKQVNQGTLPPVTNGPLGGSIADREAAQALDRLLTLNKGSGEKQQHERVKTFLKVARTDSRQFSDSAKIEQSIAQKAQRFAAGMERSRMHRGVVVREAPALGESIEHSGIYAELDRILTHYSSPNAICREAQALCDSVAKEQYHGYSDSHPRPTHLNDAVRTVLRDCLKENLKPAQRVTYMRSALEAFRPAAEQASSHAEFDMRVAQNSQRPFVPAPLPEGWEANAAPFRYERRGALHPDKLERTVKKTLKTGGIGAGVLSVLGAPAVWLMQPSSQPSSGTDISASSGALETTDYYARESARFDAQTRISDERRRETMSDLPPMKPYHDEYRVKPQLLPTHGGYEDKEQQAYYACLERNTDPATDMLRPDADCISPDIKRMQDEADAKYGTHQPETSQDDSTVPPISAAPPPAAWAVAEYGTPDTTITGDGSERDVARVHADTTQQNR